MTRLICCLVLLFSVTAWSAPECKNAGDIHPLCGLSRPEDPEVLPDGHHLLASELNAVVKESITDVKWEPGAPVRVNVDNGEIDRLYPPTGKAAKPGRNVWGDAACPGEIGAALSPHGIHLSRRSDGRWQLLVVNHGGRESIEMFELLNGKRLTWRGCAVAPAPTLNDVTAIPDGGFLATNFVDTTNHEMASHFLEYARRGDNTGFVWRWTHADGFKAVPGSEATMPNGIQVDRDGKYFYYAVMGQHSEVRKVELATGKQVGVVKVDHPDNLSWDGDKLLAAGPDNILSAACVSGAGECKRAFHIAVIDPEKLSTETIFNGNDPVVGANVSVAVRLGRRLYIGANVGDRILSVPYSIKRE